MCFHSWPNELKMTQDIKIEKKSLTPETDGVDYIWIFFLSLSLTFALGCCNANGSVSL